MKTISASTFLVISLTVIANVHAIPAGITPDVSSTGINTDTGRGISPTTTSMNKVGSAAPGDDELSAFTKTQDSHDDDAEGDSHPDTNSNSDFDSAFDSDPSSSSKSHGDPDALHDNEPVIIPDTVSFDNESPSSPDTKSDLGHNPGSSNKLDAGSNPKAKTIASGDDEPESTVSNGPSTDPAGDSTTALFDDTFTASDDSPTATNFASVSDHPMTWSVSAATMMALPKPRPPPSPPATIMPLTSTVPHLSVMSTLSTSISSGAFRMEVISREGAIIALFLGAMEVFL